MPLNFCYSEFAISGVICMGSLHGLKCEDVDSVTESKR